MRRTVIIMLWACLCLALGGGLRAQDNSQRYPKREFRAAWIQCVNGQFKGMAPEAMRQNLVSQLNALQRPRIKAIRYVLRPMRSTLRSWSLGAASSRASRARPLSPCGTRCSS